MRRLPLLLLLVFVILPIAERAAGADSTEATAGTKETAVSDRRTVDADRLSTWLATLDRGHPPRLSETPSSRSFVRSWRNEA